MGQTLHEQRMFWHPVSLFQWSQRVSVTLNYYPNIYEVVVFVIKYQCIAKDTDTNAFSLKNVSTVLNSFGMILNFTALYPVSTC